ncbi:MAG: 50S ribosomal protein L24 [Cytophagales bacterium]|nr:50S ribosomal protein L24 [Cytophagales bacterium]
MKRKKNKQPKLYIKKDDNVKIIAGNNKGKTGRVLKMFPAQRQAIIEGISMVSAHMKKSENNPVGKIVKKEMPIHISNIMLIDPASGDPTRVGRKINKDGKLQRYSKQTGEFIKE